MTEINRVLDGDTIDVTIDLGFDLYKKEELELQELIRQERTRDLEEKALGIDTTNWMKEKLEVQLLEMTNSLLELNWLVVWVSTVAFLVGYILEMQNYH